MRHLCIKYFIIRRCTSNLNKTHLIAQRAIKPKSHIIAYSTIGTQYVICFVERCGDNTKFADVHNATDPLPAIIPVRAHYHPGRGERFYVLYVIYIESVRSLLCEPFIDILRAHCTAPNPPPNAHINT